MTSKDDLHEMFEIMGERLESGLRRKLQHIELMMAFRTSRALEIEKQRIDEALDDLKRTIGQYREKNEPPAKPPILRIVK